MLTPDTLNKINSYRPQGHPEYSQSDVSSFHILASNNLLHSDLFRWNLPSLKQMARTYPGKPLMLDHDWEDVLKQCGFIYDASLLHYAHPSPELKAHMLAHSPKPELDKAIIEKEGLYQLLCHCATETSHPITNDLQYNRKINASIGGISLKESYCPICLTSFEDQFCSHYMPGGKIHGNVKPENIAPYWIRGGFLNTMELSLVMAGNCPTARVLNSSIAQKMCLS
jgi:hypothetical protein